MDLREVGCRMKEAVLLALDFPLVEVAASHVLSGVRLRSDDSRTIHESRKLVESFELLVDSYPAFEVRLAREPCARLTSENSARGGVGGWPCISLAAELSRTRCGRPHSHRTSRPHHRRDP